jgi:uncharacterized protein YjiK
VIVVCALATALGCQVPRSLGGADASSAIYGLERAARHRVDASVTEPSDLAFDPGTNTFWTVSDQDGAVYRITGEGKTVGQPIAGVGIDLEGVAFDPVSGRLFVADEGKREVIEMTRDGTVVKRFAVPVKSVNTGLEGIAYDSRRDEIILVHERNPAELIFCTRAGKMTRRVPVGTEDLSAVAVAPGGETVLVVGRFEEAVIEVDRKGNRLNRLALNVPGVEGLAFDGAGNLYAVTDRGDGAAGDLYRFSREKKPWE